MKNKQKVVVISQWDDSAMYINGSLILGGDCKEVNGAISALNKLKIPIDYKVIQYDIWKTKGGWPKRLSRVSNTITPNEI